MNCKFCNAEIREELEICPVCGKSLTEEEIPAENIAVEIVEEEAPAEALAQEITEEAEVLEQPAKKKVWPLVLAIAGAVVALGVLAVVLLTALGVDLKPKANDIHIKENYTVVDEDGAKTADTVIATVNGKELTNSVLHIYYRMQVIDFLNYYGDYISYMGFDYAKPLSEQTSAYDENMTWEQYFLQAALETWQNYQTVVLLAEEADFTAREAWETEMKELPEALEEQAIEGGYENAQDMVEQILGACCTVEDYLEYVNLVTIANEFYTTEYERLTPTDAEVEAYFEENADAFAESGITKESGLVSSVRHILIAPEGGQTDEETGETTYSDKELAAAKKKAEKLLKEWKKGEATEESFAALVNENTDDTGSAETGGLYEGITPTSNYVENFLKWSVDMSRKTGDTDIVETEFGYHIMYFVSGKPHWKQEANTMLLSERTTKMIDDAEAKWPMVVNYSKAILTELDVA